MSEKIFTREKSRSINLPKKLTSAKSLTLYKSQQQWRQEGNYSDEEEPLSGNQPILWLDSALKAPS